MLSKCRIVIRCSLAGLRDQPAPSTLPAVASMRRRPCSCEMPIITDVMLLPAEAIIESRLGVQPFQYRSATMRPFHSITTALVCCVPAQSSAERSEAVSQPAAAGDMVSHVSPETGGKYRALAAGVPGVPGIAGVPGVMGVVGVVGVPPPQAVASSTSDASENRRVFIAYVTSETGRR